MSLRAVWQELSTPQRFEDDWYAWATNQIGHVGLGMFGVWIMCMLFFVVLGEFPYRATVFLFFSAVYVYFELRKQRWSGWDTIEDVLFVCVYGAGGTLYSFTEFEVHSSQVVLDVFAPLPFLLASVLHLCAGITYRLRRARDD